ncbi:MAG: AAA family ATPase [Eubacterium sp.]|nr:AAA family ATPase [Eubacterium sp.]
MFGKEPKQSISRESDVARIVDTFSDEDYSEQFYIVTGVRGSGKTVFMTDVANQLKKKKDWIVIELNSEMNLLEDFASKLSSERQLIEGFKSAKINLSFFGFGLEITGEPPITNIEVAIARMLESVKKQKKRVLIAIDEVYNSKSMREFSSAYQILIRNDLPIFLIMTGLFENVEELQRQKNLTFLLRTPKVILSPLNTVRMADNYEKTLGVDRDKALRMAEITKGYSYAFQLLGYYSWENSGKYEEVLDEVKHYLEDTVYEKIWSEMSRRDKMVAKAIAKSENGKVLEIRKIMDISNDEFNPYKKRLEKKGLITKEYGYVNFALPMFKEFVLEQSI